MMTLAEDNGLCWTSPKTSLKLTIRNKCKISSIITILLYNYVVKLDQILDILKDLINLSLLSQKRMDPLEQPT